MSGSFQTFFDWRATIRLCGRGKTQGIHRTDTIESYNFVDALHWARACNAQLSHSGVKRASIQSEPRGGAGRPANHPTRVP